MRAHVVVVDCSDSRESLTSRQPDLGAYRYIESAGAVTYRAVNLPADDQHPQQRSPLPDVTMVMGANGLHVPYEPRHQHPNFTTTNNVLGQSKPQRFVTEEYRYHPRAHTFTNQFSGQYRSFGLSTQKDEVRVHRGPMRRGAARHTQQTTGQDASCRAGGTRRKSAMQMPNA
jgi:hypothetical protein